MTLKTRKIRVNLELPDGSAAAYAAISAELTSYEVDGLLIVPTLVRGQTDATGMALIELWPNSRGTAGSQYKIKASKSGAPLLNVIVTVPDGDETEIALESIITPVTPPTVDAATLAVLQAQHQVDLATTQRTLAAGDVVLTHADVELTHADVVLTHEDVTLTHADADQTALDRIATGADRSTVSADKATVIADMGTVSADKATTSGYKDAAASSASTATTQAGTATTQAGIATAKAVLTTADAVSTAADRVQTGLDRTSTTASAGTATTQAGTATTQAGIATAKAVLTAADAVSTAADRVQTGLDRTSTTASAGTATAQAGISTTQAGISTTQATNSAASYTAFDKRFLGSKAVAPTLDNQGAALATGALYWDTALAALRVWDGAAWNNNTTEVDARVLGDQQLLGGVEYATDMALQAVREIIRSEASLTTRANAIDVTVATYDSAITNAIYELTHLADLIGATARAVSGGQIMLGAGTAALPSLQPLNDPDTGTWYPAANTIAWSTGGTERMRIDGNGYFGLGTNAPSGVLDVNDNRLRVRTAKTPASATAAGNAGEFCWDASYFYVCTSTNVWRRTAHATW